MEGIASTDFLKWSFVGDEWRVCFPLTLIELGHPAVPLLSLGAKAILQ